MVRDERTMINPIIKKLQFTKNYYVEGRASIADLFVPKRRCGIYLLHFSNGEYYVGQAIDVTRRYVQHSKIHDDIQRISFKEIKKEKLNEVERETIKELESKKIPIRNISLTSIPKGESDFDLIMPLNHQEKWLSDLSFLDTTGKRPVAEEQRRKYQKKFKGFENKPYSQQSIIVLSEYVKAAIPAIKRGELSFWCCSCLPSYSYNPKIKVYSRINVYWQEVFTVYSFNKGLLFSWHLARSPLEAKWGRSLLGLRIRYPKIRIFEDFYPSGGTDQLTIQIKGHESALKILHNKTILSGIRLFNLRLMKKGACNSSRYHCFSLADKIIPE
jgi:hypothetical protein